MLKYNARLMRERNLPPAERCGSVSFHLRNDEADDPQGTGPSTAMAALQWIPPSYS